MTILFVILIVLACVLLGLIILVQNPKGGGLASNVAGFSNQFMGVKQTTDVLEKSTWMVAIFVALLCLFSALFVHRASSVQIRDTKVSPVSTPVSPSTNNQQAPATLPQQPK